MPRVQSDNYGVRLATTTVAGPALPLTPKTSVGCWPAIGDTARVTGHSARSCTKAAALDALLKPAQHEQ